MASRCLQAWDQSVYNQELFFLAHGPYTAPNVTVRVMDIQIFMNSKVRCSWLPTSISRSHPLAHPCTAGAVQDGAASAKSAAAAACHGAHQLPP